MHSWRGGAGYPAVSPGARSLFQRPEANQSLDFGPDAMNRLQGILSHHTWATGSGQRRARQATSLRRDACMISLR